ncbi:hypothetical protein IH781_01650 [Patescibacteria group bacterium]|nr:hypothetical protein [Patescibacteria group bacterium]
MSRELTEYNPVIVIVEEARPNRFLTGFNYLNFIERTPELRAMLANYEASTVQFSLNGLDSYRLYFRQDIADSRPKLID